MNKKQRQLKLKWATYDQQVRKYNVGRRRADCLPHPNFDDVKTYTIDHEFWNVGHLTHPDAPWAVDTNTQAGIKTYLDVRGFQEDLRRIAREVRNMIHQALNTDQKLQELNVWSNQCEYYGPVVLTVHYIH